MNNVNFKMKLVSAARGGIAGFFLVLLGNIAVLVVGIMEGAVVFGGGLHSWKDNLVTAIFVPVLISLGAALPGWVLGNKWWRGLLAGIIAMAAFIYIELNGGKQFNYGIFSQRETIAYISTALVSVLVATVGRNEFQPRGYVLIFAISAVSVGLRFIVPEENFVAGFVVSLLAWSLLPTAIAFFDKRQDKNGDANGNM
jgi:hypothetical protein